MRFITGALISLGLATSAMGQALENGATTESYISYVSIVPCSGWSYDGSINGYKCNYTGWRVDVPEYRDVQRLANLVDTLERKISDLEARVSRLESESGE